jgi:hypothetical protein
MSAKLDNLEQSLDRAYLAGSLWSEMRDAIRYARRLEIALEFYASSANYARQGDDGNYLILEENGELAREALRKGGGR